MISFKHHPIFSKYQKKITIAIAIIHKTSIIIKLQYNCTIQNDMIKISLVILFMSSNMWLKLKITIVVGLTSATSCRGKKYCKTK